MGLGVSTPDLGVVVSFSQERDGRWQQRLIVLYCPSCGGFVAAARDPKLLELALRMHVCPESLAFANRTPLAR